MMERLRTTGGGGLSRGKEKAKSRGPMQWEQRYRLRGEAELLATT